MHKGGSRAKADYRDNIFRPLEKIQLETLLIDGDCDIWTEYDIWRSGQHFFTTHSSNKWVPRHEIELQY